METTKILQAGFELGSLIATEDENRKQIVENPYHAIQQQDELIKSEDIRSEISNIYDFFAESEIEDEFEEEFSERYKLWFNTGYFAVQTATQVSQLLTRDCSIDQQSISSPLSYLIEQNEDPSCDMLTLHQKRVSDVLQETPPQLSGAFVETFERVFEEE